MKKIITTITGLNLIGILIVVNLIGGIYRLPKFDLTSNGTHTLSKASVETIKKLDDVVKVNVYMTGDLPGEVKPVASSLKTILEEMRRTNPSKFKVSYFDPGKSREARLEAERLGIQPLQFSSVKEDKFEVLNGYFGLAINYAKKQEVMPIAGDVGNIEYFLVSTLGKLTRDKVPVVAVAENGYEPGATNLNYLRKYLRQSYRVVDVDLNGEVKMLDEAAALIIVGRTKKLDQKWVEKLKNWVDSGRGLVAFVDKVEVNGEMAATKIEDTGLDEVFKKYGIVIEKKLVWDQNGTIANFRGPKGAFLTQYPYWPQIGTKNIDSSLPITSGINSLLMAWVSPLTVEGSAKVLVKSSQESRVTEDVSDLSPASKRVIDKTGSGSYPLAAINTNGVKIVVFGDGDMVSDQFVANNQANLLIALNSVDYLTSETSLMTIRSKQIASAPIASVEETVKTAVKAANMVVPLIILLVVYLAVMFIQKKGYVSFQKRLV